MAIPPFPSQDLAKLVLGYLAEEQLMTAYDEFLLASPYLDVMRNEYDRIFMTSLKSILAEYRAVKIYVETCKPFMLRKKLFQCSNLLEIVKFLTSCVDINRLQAQEGCADKISSRQTYMRSACDVCNAVNCTCKESHKPAHTTSHIETSSPENSVETTALSDLPGNSLTTKKSYKELLPGTMSHTDSSVQLIDPTIQNNSTLSKTKELESKQELQATQDGTNCTSQLPQDSSPSINTVITQDLTSRSDESKQKIEEFNNIYNLVCNNNSSLLPKSSISNIGNAGTFQEFASGVCGSSDKDRTIVPDSSPSKNNITQTSDRKDKDLQINQITSIKGQSTPQFLLKVGISKNPSSKKSSQQQNTQKNELSRVKILPKPKQDDQKIKIISDVKVDNLKSKKILTPMNPTTSTPLLQMQTILINGTPAYKNNTPTGTNYTYTKDEIMAMPTIIIVPASGSKADAPSDQISTVQCVNTETITTTSTKTKTSTARGLGPLVIDVSSNNALPVSNTDTITESTLKEAPKFQTENIIQTIDLTHSSVPKDTNLTSDKTSTPQVLPPVRKSSSTPRRTSHVRVLDFTTPRRILHETINEQDPNNVVIEEKTDTNTAQSTQANNDKVTAENTDSASTVMKSSTKENSVKIKKNNWDAQLRALAIRNDDDMVFTPKPKQKKAKTIKKISPNENAKLDNTAPDAKNKATPKVKRKKKIKAVIDLEKVEKEPVPQVVTTCTKMPTVNVVTETNWNNATKENLDQVDQVKLNLSDERVDTPETERLSLQNVIGAKLNISDLLETPYKQVLYDIQMETPKFLGPDIPDMPISDIKIMNIPTPRFLNTPKPLQATPSSYSSRPTDYSSGGSYYKPDDQDFIPSSDVLNCAVNFVDDSPKDIEKNKEPEKNKESKKTPVTKSEVKEISQRSSRPQRRCTRNVSYKSPHLAKTNDDNADKNSLSSETSNASTREKKTNKSVDTKNKLNTKKEDKPKKDIKKKAVSTHKTAIKKETPKKYIRIKPFKKTPVNDSPLKGRKKTSDVLHTLSAKTLSRKRTSSKEKNTTAMPVVSAAPTKSRRKSSTPRKLHCTKSFNSSTEQNSSDLAKNLETIAHNITGSYQESDSEHQPLRWSDDGSQDDKLKDSTTDVDNDEIDKIKQYIEMSVPEKVLDENIEGSLHVDLMRRGFDVETAKIIERDLLDTTPVKDPLIEATNTTHVKEVKYLNVSDKIESEGSLPNNFQKVQNEDEYEEEEIELSSYDCNQETKNYVTLEFDESKFVEKDIPKLKDKFSMEVCIDDGVAIRLRATPFESFFEKFQDIVIDPKETEAAVNSISNIDKLYTPMKDARARCYEIFDSTLTSIDTPLKTEPVYETTVAEIVLEVENIDGKDKTEAKKRKRLQSGNSDESLNKKTKSDTQYLLNTTNIQNIDIESVLSKLHGP